MIDHPDCPVCDSDQWEAIGTRTYTKSSSDPANQYVQKRLRVLFEVWHPGKEQVTNQSLLCRQCGIVIYSPRPTADDLNRKYQFLGTLEADDNQKQITAGGEARRAERLRKKIAGFLGAREARILDFGGGDGRLLKPFADRGCACFVIDYCERPIPGVERLGATLNEVADVDPFDAVICSHVIEHLADPRETLQRLRRWLKPGGIIYVEVPMEIWRRAPLLREPVTHVNFFTDQSLRVLFQEAGFSRVQSRLERYHHPLGHRDVVVAGFATNDPDETVDVRYRGSVERTKSLLNPRWIDRVERALLDPVAVPRHLVRRLTRVRTC